MDNGRVPYRLATEACPLGPYMMFAYGLASTRAAAVRGWVKGCFRRGEAIEA